MTSTRQAATHGSQSHTRFDANHWRGQVCRFDGSELTPGPGNYWRTFDRIDASDSASYGDFSPDADGRYFLSDFLSGSDYSGSLVERANYRDFLAEYGERDGVHEVYGGHGTYAVAVRIDAIDDEMAALFDGLEDYPLVSEETHSELELEAQQEAWESWAESDFSRAVETAFGEDLDFPDRTIATHFTCAFSERLFSVLHRNRIDHTLALDRLESRLDDCPFGGVDHYGNPGDIGLGREQVEEACHRRLGVEEALVHVHVDDLGATLNLLERYLDRRFVVILLDQAREATRAGNIGPLAHVGEEGVRTEVERFETGKARTARRGRKRAG